MSTLIGKKFGNYVLLDHIGDGGFADVYKGEHINLGVFHAVKVLKAQVKGNESQQFLKEARTLANLRHRHIVPVHNFEVIDTTKTAYLAMDLATDTLLHRLDTRHQLSLLETVSIIKQVAEALQFVHDNGFVHRDIKPENILFNPEGEIWLSDFGIAIASQDQKKQEAIGTVEYMAPEQIQGYPCPASDQYALAIIAYQCLSGSCPFEGTKPQDVAAQHLQTPPPPLYAKVPTIPAGVESVIQLALAKKPEERFPGVKEFAIKLEQASGVITVNLIQATPATVQANPASVPNPQAVLGTTKVLPQVVAPTKKVKQPVGTCVYTFTGHSDFVRALCWSPDSKRIASASDDRTVRIWDADSGKSFCTYSDHHAQVWTIAWSPDGQYIASGSGRQVAQIWKAAQGTCLITYKGHNLAAGRFMVAWSPDSTTIASAGYDKTVQVWQAGSGIRSFSYTGHQAPVNVVAWSPDGQRIASAGDDTTVQVWQAATGKTLLIHRGHRNEVLTLAWSPDGKFLASAGRDRTVQIWDSLNGDRISTYTKHERRILALAWSPDGKFIASVDDDRVIQVWEVATEKVLFTCDGHTATVNGLAWSPDGDFIASASNDKTVRVWQA